jgi:endonuclease YncB( thermonuclease family)
MILLLLFLLPSMASADSFHGVRVNRVYDGDTVIVTLPGVTPFFGKNIGVRLRGIDAPEISAKGCERQLALRSRDRVKSLLAGAKKVDLLEVGKDKYFRILADVQADGKSVSRILLQENLARPYDGGTKLKGGWCK